MTAIDIKFLERFPNGLEDETWLAMGKKHKPDKIVAMLNTELSKENLGKLIEKEHYSKICEISLILIKKATVVSMFEKIAFTNFISNENIHKEFSVSLYNLLYNFNNINFEKFVDVLLTFRKNKNSNAGKWPVVTFFLAYMDPNTFTLVKPNTVKAIANILHCDIEYKPLPNYNTYMKVIDMVTNFRKTSSLCKDENLMITQAVLYCVVN